MSSYLYDNVFSIFFVPVKLIISLEIVLVILMFVHL